MSARFESLLAVDLDGTLVGDAASLAHLNRAIAPLRERVGIAYVTGRGLASAQRLLQEEALLTPDFLLTGVGTGIYRGPRWSPNPAWMRHLSRNWDGLRIRRLCEGFPALTPQPAACQGPFKCSYQLGRGEPTLTHLAEALTRSRLGARLIYSSGRDLDVVPESAGKGNAVRFLALTLGIAISSVLACGDSGNDLDMLSLGGPAAIVANATPELVEGADSHVYRSNLSHAAGVLDALRHFGWL